MSDPRTKAERSRAKDARQMPAPDIAVGRGRSRKQKRTTGELVQTEMRWKMKMFNRPDVLEWRKYKPYRNRAVAEKAIADLNRKYERLFEYRIKP